ncbi:hypothetical protein [Frigoribacterium sp. CFBP 13707]|uniref:hypothetical protein n=1 Tax=Frigoribacterium sp. CFBP 13707 TaxID=2775313 RepID=UPI00177C6337|nr:hypothetical protein [Frigoribacterium sp. CFBP 13707]MBD8728791.1 hypothetical protein [Frigoribacterium sp. CFBP 13707]
MPGTPGSDDRRAELVAAALGDDLSPAEADEFARLRAADPTIDRELAELGGLPGALAGLGSWQDVEPSAELRRRVEGVAGPEAPGATASTTGPAPVAGTAPPAPRAPQAPGHASAPAPTAPSAPSAPVTPLRPRRRPLLTVLGAAACLALGAGVGALVAAPRDTTPEGPAGTLGAVEPIDFAGAPTGVRVEGDLVAHTWGTETLLTVTGLPVGTAFSVVVIDDEGGEHPSGAFLGTEVEIDCQLNAAVTRDHVRSVEIRGADGELAVAAVPAVA